MNKKNNENILFGLIAVTLLIIVVNAYQLSSLTTSSNNMGSLATGSVTTSLVASLKGIPEFYGNDLDFYYEDIDPYDPAKADVAISKFSNLDRSITLTSNELERYIKILYTDFGGISCEYCCGARSIISENGQSACGCAHAYAMRGIRKYLIRNYPDMSDTLILEEVSKLKMLFFPGIHEGKEQIMKEQGIEVNFLSLATNANRGIEKGQASGGMVGGC